MQEAAAGQRLVSGANSPTTGQLPADRRNRRPGSPRPANNQPAAWTELSLDHEAFRVLVPHAEVGRGTSYVSALRADVIPAPLPSLRVPAPVPIGAQNARIGTVNMSAHTETPLEQIRRFARSSEEIAGRC
jgi:hypothetical protein